jgi:thymidine phosphorylase
MVAIGEGAGRRTVALITAMDNPLGRSVGNALEVREALDVLGGSGDAELREVSVRVAAEMCRLAGVNRDPAEAIADGSGLARFERMLAAQGGRLAEGLPEAPVQVALPAPATGWVGSIDALEVGYASVELGAGRLRKGEPIDHAAGIVIELQVGDRVEAGRPLAVLHAASRELTDRAAERLLGAWRIAPHEVARPPHILERVDAG